MDMQTVRELAALMEEKGLTTVELEQGDGRVLLKKEVAVAAVAPLKVPDAPAAAPAAVAEADVVDFNGVTEVKAPMVGTAYTAAAPGEEPYVHVGDKVKKGQPLCVIEAMKLMNELPAPCDGEVVDICVQDGQLVEYGQCLFKLY